jgi:hypothetical protein
VTTAGQHAPFCNMSCAGDMHWLSASNHPEEHVHSNSQRPFCGTCAEEPRATCPDCAQGKHGACVGDAWDDEFDRPALCQCFEWNHQEKP